MGGYKSIHSKEGKRRKERFQRSRGLVDPLFQEAGSNAFTLSPTKWIEQTNAIGIVCTTGRNGGTYAQRDIAFKFANWVSVEFEL